MLQHVPDVLFRVGEHDAKHAAPVGEHMEEAVAHLLGEEAEPVPALGEGVDDVGDEGGEEQPQLLQVGHHPVILSLQAVPVPSAMNVK